MPANLSGNAPLTVQFVDTSLNNPTQWAWDFGNGMTSTLKNPLPVVYNNPGVYTVSLTVSNNDGSDTETLVGYVTVLAVATCFLIDNFVGPSGMDTHISDTGSGWIAIPGIEYKFDGFDVLNKGLTPANTESSKFAMSTVVPPSADYYVQVELQDYTDSMGSIEIYCRAFPINGDGLYIGGYCLTIRKIDDISFYYDLQGITETVMWDIATDMYVEVPNVATSKIALQVDGNIASVFVNDVFESQYSAAASNGTIIPDPGSVVVGIKPRNNTIIINKLVACPPRPIG